MTAHPVPAGTRPGSRVHPRRRRAAARPLDFGPYRDFAHRVDAIRRDIVVGALALSGNSAELTSLIQGPSVQEPHYR